MRVQYLSLFRRLQKRVGAIGSADVSVVRWWLAAERQVNRGPKRSLPE